MVALPRMTASLAHELRHPSRYQFLWVCHFLADSERICVDGMLERALRNSEHWSMDVSFKNAKLQMSPPLPSLKEKHLSHCTMEFLIHVFQGLITMR